MNRDGWIAVCFAAVMSFALGGTIVWGLRPLNPQIEQQSAALEEKGSDDSAQNEGNEAALARYTWWLTAFTGSLAFATIGLGIATAGLYFAGERQLRHLERESKRQSREMNASIEVARHSAAAASESNELARENLIADQRAWISVDCILAGPITWDVNGCRINMRFTLKNVGRTPALNVSIFPQAYSAVGEVDPLGKQVAHADSMRAGIAIGTTIFPNDVAVQFISTYIDKSEIERSREWFKKTTGKDDIDWINPMIVGCANYNFVFGGPAHQTGFIYEIRQHIPINNSVAISPSVGDVPLTHLRLSRWIKDGRTD